MPFHKHRLRRVWCRALWSLLAIIKWSIIGDILMRARPSITGPCNNLIIKARDIVIAYMLMQSNSPPEQRKQDSTSLWLLLKFFARRGAIYTPTCRPAGGALHIKINHAENRILISDCLSTGGKLFVCALVQLNWIRTESRKKRRSEKAHRDEINLEHEKIVMSEETCCKQWK